MAVNSGKIPVMVRGSMKGGVGAGVREKAMLSHAHDDDGWLAEHRILITIKGYLPMHCWKRE